MNGLHKILFKAGQRWRNPSLAGHYAFLKRSEGWSREQLIDYQWEKLLETIHYAWEHSAFYRQKWTEAGVHPGDIKTPEDVRKIPVVSKQELIHHNAEVHSDEYFGRKFYAVTSGTTGESLSFWKDENADSFNRAAIFRGYSWYGVEPWEFNGYFWGFSFGFLQRIKMRMMDWMVNRYRLFSYNDRDLARFARKMRRAKYLEGYSSAIYQTARLILERDLPRPSGLKLVKGTSEKIYPHYHEATLAAFGQPVRSEYGAAESGVIAFECPEGHMHITSEGVYVEEENGEIIVTNLVMRSFPVVRYALGDYIRLKPADFRCACGMEHPVIEEVTGRVGTTVYGKTGVYPSLYFYYVFKNLNKNHGIKLSYQVVQPEKGYLVFRLERKLSAAERKALATEIEALFKDDVEYELREGEVLFPDGRKGKFRDFVSEVE